MPRLLFPSDPGHRRVAAAAARPIFLAVALSALVGSAAAPSAIAAPKRVSLPSGVVAGAPGKDGSAWFTFVPHTRGDHPKVVKLSPSGRKTVITLAGHANPIRLLVAPDGTAWVSLTRYGERGLTDLVAIGANDRPRRIPIHVSLSEQPEIIGPDGNLWVQESNAIAVVTSAGQVTRFPTVTGGWIGTLGDRLAWAGEPPNDDPQLFGLITTAGVVSIQPLAIPDDLEVLDSSFTAEVGGNIYLQLDCRRIDRCFHFSVLHQDGTVVTSRRFAGLPGYSVANWLDGSAWVAVGSHLYRIDPAANVTEIRFPRVQNSRELRSLRALTTAGQATQGYALEALPPTWGTALVRYTSAGHRTIIRRLPTPARTFWGPGMMTSRHSGWAVSTTSVGRVSNSVAVRLQLP